MTEKRKVGRPRTTVNDLPDNWREMMRECGQHGGTGVECRALLGIGEAAWYTLLEDSEEFREADEVRKTLAEVWYQREGRRMIQEGKGNAATWIFTMKNMFNWTDKAELDHSSKDGSMSPTRIEIVPAKHDNGND